MFTKLGKKIMAFFAVALLSLSLASCVTGSKGATMEEAQANVDAVIQAIVYDSTVLSDVTANLPAVKQNANYPDVKLEWSSSEEDIVSFATSAQGIHQMVVNRPKGDDARVVDGYAPVTVTVTASQVVADGTATANKTFNLKVKALDNQFFGTVSEVVANYLNTLKESNTTLNEAGNATGDKYVSIYSVTYGRVEYIYSKGFYIADGDAGIYVYGNTEGLKLGDLVKVSGQVYAYWGVIEYGKEINVEVLSATDKVVDLDGNEVRTQASFVRANYEEKGIKEYTDALAASYVNEYTGSKYEAGLVNDAAAFANYSGATYTLTGQLIKEKLATQDSYALVDPVYGTKIALYHYCTDDATETLDALDGKFVQLQVVTVDRYSSNAMFRVLWNGTEITEVAAPELTDEEKVNKAAYEIENTVLPSLYYNGDAFTAPTTTVEGVTVVWAANEHVVDGKIVATEAGTATLTATLTCGEATATATITINLEAKEVINTIAEFAAAADGTVMTIKGVIVAKFASNGKYAYVQDETGTILVYASLANKEGDTVKLLATKGSYNGTPQVKSDNLSETLVEEGEWTIATPTQVTIAEVKAYTAATAPFGAYLQATGKLTKNTYGYYYLTDGTNEISLYNSNVTEELALFAGLDREVTLNFYMYGNSESDWSGDLRVIFCGREGEYSYEGDAPTPTPDLEDKEATVAEFLAAEVNADQWYILTGKVESLTNTTYGNFNLVDETGTVYVYGLTATKVASNDKSFATLNIQEGDIVTLKGLRAEFNSAAQVGGPAYYVSHYTPELTDAEKAAKVLDAIVVAATATDDFTLAEVEGVVWSLKSGDAATLAGNTVTVTRPAAGQVDATVVFTATYTLNDVDYTKDFTVTVPALVEVVAGDPVTVSKTIEELAAANAWENSTVYSTFKLDDVITVSASVNDYNGRYHTSGQNYRLYQALNGSVTISAETGYKIDSVKITYSISNTGTLLDANGAVVSSDTVVAVNGSSVTFTVGNTGTATNGQARVTAIEVVYVAE